MASSNQLPWIKQKICNDNRQPDPAPSTQQSRFSWQVELEGFCANAKVCAVGVSPVVFLSRLFSAFRPTRAGLSDFQSPLLDASSFAT